MIFGADSETTGLSLQHRDHPFMFSTFDGENARVWRWDVDPLTRLPDVPASDLDDIADHCWGNDLVFHNAIFDLRAMSTLGLQFEFAHRGHFTDQLIFPPGRRKPLHKLRVVECGELHDTQLMSHAVRSPGAGGSHSLKDLCFFYFDYLNLDEQDLHKATIAARRIGKKLGWTLGTDLHGASAVKSDYWMPRAVHNYCWNCSPEELEAIDPPDNWQDICQIYNVGDSERTLALYYFLLGIADEEPKLLHAYEREMRLAPVTYRMENHGMAISQPRLEEQIKFFELEAAKCANIVHDGIQNTTGLDVNINSGQQLTEWLFAAGLPLWRRTKTGFSTDAGALTDLAQYAEAHQRPGEAAILRAIVGHDEDLGDDQTTAGYRTYIGGVRFLNSYHDFMIRYGAIVARLFPSFNQSGTKFTRYSCSEPNGQNISTQAVLPLRTIYGPPPGYLWLDPDYSQVELRIFAHVSGDKSMQEAFERGYDFHVFTASKLYSLSQEKITSEMKRRAKGVNFKAIYGGINNVPEEYSRQFPRAASFMREMEAVVRSCGYVETVQGDRIYIDPEKPYVAVDAICQGSAGRVIKDAMTMLHETQVIDWTGCSICANVHDQLVIEVSTDYPVRRLAKTITRIMEQAGSVYGLNTPVEMKIVHPGCSWDHSEKFNLCQKSA